MNRFSDINWTAVFTYFAAVALLALAIFLVVQPAEHYELQGVVVDKIHRLPKTTVTYISQCNSNGLCTITPRYNQESDRYYLSLIVNDTISNYSVSGEMYIKTSVGDRVTITCSKGKVMQITVCEVK